MNEECLPKAILFLTNNENTMTLYKWLCQNNKNVYLYSEKITINKVENIKPEVIISYNYSYLINQEIISYMQGRIFNLHISYLPWNKGSNPNFWSFVDSTPKGVTIHRVDVGLDTGEILCQKLVDFDEEKETFRTSYSILNQEITALLVENWNDIQSNKIQGEKQKRKGTYHTMQEFIDFVKVYPINWDEKIADYKKKIIRNSDDWNKSRC